MLVGELSRWGNRREEVDALLPGGRRRAAVDHRLRRQGRRRLRRVPAHDRPRACRTRVGRTPGTRCASSTARWRRRRSRCARCRATCTPRSIARSHCATEAGDDELAASLRRARRRAEAPVQRGLLGRDTPTAATSRSGLDRDKQRDRRHRFEHGPLPLDRHRRRGEGAARRARADVATACSAGGGSARCRRTNGGYNPISYHCGSVWPHDNAICAAGLDALRLRRRGAPRDARARRRVAVVRRPAARAVRGHAARGTRLPGELPDVVLTAGVGRGVAAAVPAHDAALRARHPQRRSCTSRRRSPTGSARLRLERIPIMGGHLGVEVDGRRRARARGPRRARDRFRPPLRRRAL